MRFDLRDLDATQWVTYERDGEQLRVELRRLTSEKHLELTTRFRARTEKDTFDFSGLLEFIAEKLIVSFEGAVDHEGNPLPNTVEVRRAMLFAENDLCDLIVLKLRSWADREIEGNAERASD